MFPERHAIARFLTRRSALAPTAEARSRRPVGVQAAHGRTCGARSFSMDALSDAPLLQRGNRVAPIDRRNDGQLKSRDAFEADGVVLAFNGRGRRRKCELLPDNFASTANCECSEYRIPACVIALAPRKSSALCSAGRVLARSDESSGVLDQMPAIQCVDPAEAPLRWASWHPRMSALPQHPEG